jgi:hypothetical protein
LRTTTKNHITSIYFLSGGDLIKIGRSADADTRIRKLRASSPYRLEVLCVRHNVRACVEVYLHTKFAKFRRHGEWFSDAPEIRAEIDLILKGQAPYMRKNFRFVPNWHLADPMVAATVSEREADRQLMACVG